MVRASHCVGLTFPWKIVEHGVLPWCFNKKYGTDADGAYITSCNIRVAGLNEKKTVVVSWPPILLATHARTRLIWLGSAWFCILYTGLRWNVLMIYLRFFFISPSTCFFPWSLSCVRDACKCMVKALLYLNTESPPEKKMSDETS